MENGGCGDGRHGRAQPLGALNPRKLMMMMLDRGAKRPKLDPGGACARVDIEKKKKESRGHAQ